ncbi:MAG TPA: cell division protein FtsZ, partial [Syntrophales bacterium]|nr:cell division protein FtsZ [Syntrophales bacterium]HQK79832.1 cell division protein FtsZ [Syntrophales bacterium]
MFELTDLSTTNTARIKVIGIGGGGSNAVNTMISYNLQGVDFIVANTDTQALGASTSPIKIQLGSEVTKGLGAGANPEVGRQAAT